MHALPPFATAVIFSLVSLPSHAAAPDGEWTRFRGPNGGGVIEGRFAADVGEKDFAWTVDLPGKGHGSPVLWNDRIYLTSSDADAGKRFVFCLDAKKRSVVWRRDYEFSKFRQGAENGYSSASPAVDAVGVYVAWATPEKYTLFCLDHDGKELWTQNLGPFKSVQGQGASPVVVDGVVVLANDQEGPQSSLMAFDHRTGAMQWKAERKSTDKTSMSTPVVYRPADGRPPQVVFTGKSPGFTAIDLRTGQVAWEASKVFDARTVGSPVVAGDTILAACGEGAAHRLLVAVRPGEVGRDPEVAYTVKGVAPYVPTPLVKGDRVYLWGDAGVVTCLNLVTGQQVWSEKVGGMYYGSPVCVGDTLWCMSRKGDLVGVRAGDAFEQVAKISLGEASHSTPAVAGGRMYLRTVTKLICVDLRPE